MHPADVAVMSCTFVIENIDSAVFPYLASEMGVRSIKFGLRLIARKEKAVAVPTSFSIHIASACPFDHCTSTNPPLWQVLKQVSNHQDSRYLQCQ